MIDSRCTYKSIVTFARTDGSFDEVGMNNRTIVKGRPSFIRRRAVELSKGREVRIEYFIPSRFYDDVAHKVEFI